MSYMSKRGGGGINYLRGDQKTNYNKQEDTWKSKQEQMGGGTPFMRNPGFEETGEYWGVIRLQPLRHPELMENKMIKLIRPDSYSRWRCQNFSGTIT